MTNTASRLDEFPFLGGLLVLPSGPVEILAHRVFWSLVVMLLLDVVHATWARRGLDGIRYERHLGARHVPFGDASVTTPNDFSVAGFL